MSIAAANLFSRNVYREFIRPDADPRAEARAAKIASLFVKIGALLFVIVLPYLGVFVYLITQHDGMAERGEQSARAQKAEVDDYVRSVSGGGPAS